MFTGLIQRLGHLRQARRLGSGMRLTVEVLPFFEDLDVGESVALNGACLTVVEASNPVYTVDVSPETVNKTTIGRLTPGDRVNLERALRLSDRLGGHLVTGHVDGVGVVSRMWRQGDFWRLVVEAPAPLQRHIVEKGSIAVDGISLTVAAVVGLSFEVSVIPLTYEQTTLQVLRQGALVNLETDLLAKYVERLLKPSSSECEAGEDPLMGRLREAGFV